MTSPKPVFRILSIVLVMLLTMGVFPMQVLADDDPLGFSIGYSSGYQGGTLRTLVTLNGVPQPNVSVYLYQIDQYQTHYAQTDSSGTAHFSGIQPGAGYYFFLHGSEHYLKYDGRALNDQFSLPGQVPGIELDSGNPVSTVVTLNGVAQSSVYVLLHHEEYGNVGNNFTDPSGRVSFDAQPDGGKYYFTAYGSTGQYIEYDGMALGKTFSLPGSIPNIELDPGYSVRSYVTLNGVAQPSINVTLYRNGNYMQSKYSDSNGMVEFAGLSNAGGGYYFQVSGTSNYTEYDGRTLGKSFSVPGTAPNIELSPGNTVRATVTLNGQVQPGIGVGLRSDEHAWRTYYATTDQSGVAEFTGVADDSYYYHLSSTAAYPEYFSDSFQVPGPTPDIALQSGNQLSTTVTLGGAPMPNVGVRLLQGGVSRGYRYSDSAGTVTFDAMPSGSGYYFQVESYGYNAYAEYHGKELGKTFSLPGTVPAIELNSGHTVTATVKTGTALTDFAYINLYKNDRLVETAYAYDGEVTFDNIAGGDGYFFTAYHDSPRDIKYDGQALGETFSVPGSTPIIQLGGKSEALTTKVTLNGKPVENVYISMHQVGKNSSNTIDSTSDANGIAEFRATPGSYYFEVIPNYNTYDMAPYDGMALGKVFAFPGDVPDIELTSGHTVKTRVTSNGQPVRNTKVYLHNAKLDSLFSSYTDSNGWVTFDNVPDFFGYYFSCMWYDGMLEDQIFSVPGTVPEIQLSQFETITTRVTLNGKPVIDADVFVMAADENWVPGWNHYDVNYTDANGEVELIAPVGKPLYFYVDTYNQDYYQYLEYDGRSVGKVFSLPGAVPTIELYQGATISTTVILNGVPLAYEYVELRDSTRWVAQSTVTDDNGVATFENVDPSDTYYFTVDGNSNAGYAPYNGFVLDKTFTTSGTIPDIELYAGRTVTATVTLNGVPAPNVPVSFYLGSQYRETLYVTSDSRGKVTFRNIPDISGGFFSVSAEENQYATFISDTFRVPGNVPDIPLVTGTSIVSNVTLNGSPRAGVDVTLYLNGRYTADSKVSQANGNVVFRNVSPVSTYQMRVQRTEGLHAFYQTGQFGTTNVPNIPLVTGNTVSTTVTLQGNPRAAVSVYLDNEELATYGWDVSDQSGRVSFTNMASASRYFFDAEGLRGIYDDYSTSLFAVPGQYPIIELDPAYRTTTSTSGGTSSSRGRGGSSSTDGARTTATATDPSIVDTKMAETITTTALRKAQQSGENKVVVRVKDKSSITLEAMKAMVKVAGGYPVMLHADSMVDERVDVRLYIDPSKATGDISLKASTQSSLAQAIKGMFEQHFSRTVTVVCLGQGDYGMPVEVAIKLDPGMDPDNLFFYTYDRANHSYHAFEPVNPWMDINGYLHFTTNRGGNIVISDGPILQ